MDTLFDFECMRNGLWRRGLVTFVVILVAVFGAFGLWAQQPEPQARVIQQPTETRPLVVEIDLGLQEGVHIYRSEKQFFQLSDTQSVNLGEIKLTHAPTISIPDELTEDSTDTVEVFKKGDWLRVTRSATGADGDKWSFEGNLSFQACTDSTCYPPQDLSFSFSGRIGAVQSAETAADAGSRAVAEAPPVSTESWRQTVGGFVVKGSEVGYLKASDFLAFLDRTESETGDGQSLGGRLEDKAIWTAIMLILLGGLALNLTPCVLPMIPINLAIIGAGAASGNRRQGFLLGGVYGLAIASVYGILGLVVVLTGAKFGALNASPWFNLAIAVIFLVLALAMFDVIHIDFSRFSSGASLNKWKKGSIGMALFMGSISALLAGACVAPVVIAVLLFSAKLYAGGQLLGLLLPFVLGIGMALPWPFAGAGMGLLPKPGQWMNKVKYAFGIFILLMAAYYGILGVRLAKGGQTPAATEDATLVIAGQLHWETSLDQALLKSRETGKPLFIDFWASWCKNCHAMERTTFRNEAVQARLDSFVRLKFQAEDPTQPEIKAVMDYFEVIGLPTYVVLSPSSANGTASLNNL